MIHTSFEEKNMRKNWMRLGLLPLLAAALSVAGCADRGGPLDPPQQPAVQGPSESLSLKEDLDAIMRGEAPDLSARSNEAVIGPQGGFVYVSLHYLYVPRGAVQKPTRFRMQLNEEGKLGAELTATSLGSTVENDVGRKGFKRPVYLSFSYGYVDNPPSHPARLRVMWDKGDGTWEAQPTYVDTRFRYATGVLDHFSSYLLAMP